MRVLMGIILLVILVGAISGVVLALSAGQPTVAIIIGLLAAAFFTGWAASPRVTQSPNTLHSVFAWVDDSALDRRAKMDRCE